MAKMKWSSLVAGLICACALHAFAQGQAPAALTGEVTSDAEGRMEGVLVTAKPDSGNIRVTVVSDDKGRYSFPADRLKPGGYTLAIRAVGYDLPAPIAVKIAANNRVEANIKLAKTKDLASQLSGVEWMMSVPGNEQQKKALRHCQACHTLYTVIHSKYDEKGFLALLPKMQNNYIGQSQLTHPLPSPSTRTVEDLPVDPDLAKYLASINLSDGRTTWPYELRTLPRPRGRDTKIIITEYVLSRSGAAPHDMSFDSEKRVFYTDFLNGYLGRVDPNTGENKEWKMPRLRSPQPEMSLAMDTDKDGNPWIMRQYQGCVATHFDVKTEEFHTLAPPSEYNPPNSQCSQGSVGRDGMIWEANGGSKILEFDPEKGFVKSFNSFPPDTKPGVNTPYMFYFGVGDKFNDRIRGAGQHGSYGVSVLLNGDPIYCDTLGSTITVLDHNTGKVTMYPTPTQDAFPRRGSVDSKGQFWFGEWLGDQIGMFDPETKEIQEWKPPTPWSGPYRAAADKNGEAWAGSNLSDYVFRLNPKTGSWRQYLMPRLFPDIRDIRIDDSGKQDKVWVSILQAGIIAEIEPLD